MSNHVEFSILSGTAFRTGQADKAQNLLGQLSAFPTYRLPCCNSGYCFFYAAWIAR